MKQYDLEDGKVIVENWKKKLIERELYKSSHRWHIKEKVNKDLLCFVITIHKQSCAKFRDYFAPKESRIFIMNTIKET